MATYEDLRQRVLQASGDVAASQSRVGVGGPRNPDAVRDELFNRWRQRMLLTYPKVTQALNLFTHYELQLAPAVRVFEFPRCSTVLANDYMTDKRLWDEARAAIEYYLAHEPPITAPYTEQADWVVNIFYWCQLAILSTNINFSLYRFAALDTAIKDFIDQVRDAAARQYGVELAVQRDPARQAELRRRQLGVRGALGLGTHAMTMGRLVGSDGNAAFEVCKPLYTDLKLAPWAWGSAWVTRSQVLEGRSGLADTSDAAFGRPRIYPAEFPQAVAARINGAETYDRWAEALRYMGSTFSFRDNIRTVFLVFSESPARERDFAAVAMPYLTADRVRTTTDLELNDDAPVVTVATPFGLREQAKLYGRALLSVDLGRELQSSLVWYTGEYLAGFANRGKLGIPPEELAAAANALSRASFSAVGNVVGAIGSTLSSALPPAALVTTIVAGLYNIWGALGAPSDPGDTPQPLFMRRVPSCEEWARQAAAENAMPIPLSTTPIDIGDPQDPNAGAGMSIGTKVALGTLGVVGAALLYKALTR